MSRAKRRAFCRRWGHLPAGSRCARCGADLSAGQRAERQVRAVLLAVLVALVVGLAIGHMLMPLDLARP